MMQRRVRSVRERLFRGLHCQDNASSRSVKKSPLGAGFVDEGEGLNLRKLATPWLHGPDKQNASPEGLA